MRVFYGAVIQGAKDDAEKAKRASINRTLIDTIKEEGYEVFSEHTAGKTKQETAKIFEREFGPLPASGIEREIAIRDILIQGIEGDVCAAIFEVSVPSSGVSVEFTHAYLRPRLGLPEIPILTVYKNNSCHHDLTTMIKGISPAEIPNLTQRKYHELEQAKTYVREFLSGIR